MKFTSAFLINGILIPRTLDDISGILSLLFEWSLHIPMILGAMLAVSIASERVPQARQVEGEGSDRERFPGPPGWQLRIELTIIPEKVACYETYTITSELVGVKCKHTLKMGKGVTDWNPECTETLQTKKGLIPSEGIGEIQDGHTSFARDTLIPVPGDNRDQQTPLFLCNKDRQT